MNYTELIDSIKRNVYNNKNREITGDRLQNQLTNMVSWTQDTKLDSTTDYSLLPTEDKTVLGSISEIYSKLESSGSISVIDELPAEGKPGIIYVVNSKNATKDNKKDEYIWVDGRFEPIGQGADMTTAATDPLSEDDILGIAKLDNTVKLVRQGSKLYKK